VFWIGAAAILVVAALIGLVALVAGDVDETDGEILFVLGSLFLTGSTTIAAAALRERGERPLFTAVTIATAPVTLGLLIAFAVSGFDVDAEFGKAIGSGALLVAGQLVIVTCWLLVRRTPVRPVAVAAEGLVWLATVLSLVFVWIDDDPGAAGWKLLAASWILAALGWFLVPVLQRLTPAVPADGGDGGTERVLTELAGVALVATGNPARGDLVVEGSGLVVHKSGGTVRLQPGERLVLRTR
jgi:hypothetical protein